MKIFLMALTLMFPMAAIAEKAEESENDGIARMLGLRLAQCEEVYDVQPYMKIAFDQSEEIASSELESSIEHINKNGSLPLTSDQLKKSIVVQCAAFAEGLLASANTSNQKNFNKRKAQCKSSYDVEPFMKIGRDALEESDNVNEADANAAQFFISNGYLQLNPKQAKNQTVVQCAAYAEGLLAGGLTLQIIKIFSAAMENMVTEIAKKVGEAMINGLNEGLVNGSEAKPKLDGQEGISR